MKLHFVLLGLCALTLGAVVTATTLSHRHQAAAPASPAEQRFEVKGQIRSLEADGVTVHIAHEEIPGFMPAMTMPFTVKYPVQLHGLAAGDSVRFQLVVTKDDSWITHLEKLSSAPSRASVSEPSTFNPQPSTLTAGQPVPDFTLVDQHGKTVHLEDFRGKAVLLTFIYTRCPLPNFCPLMSKNFASLQERLNKEFPDKIQLLSISFDPQFDTPETLSRYAALYQHDDKNWAFATGTPAEIDRVTGLFGLVREPSNGFINHDLRTAFIGPDGRLIHVWRSNVWTPYEVARMVRETLSPGLASAH